MKGDWEKCSEMICSMKIFNYHKNAKEIKGFISEKIKESALKCYLLFYAAQFKSICLKNICDRFALSEDKVRKIINKVVDHSHIDNNGK